MKYELLRNCSHGSHIYTFHIEDGDNKFYLKTASSHDALDNLINEYNGWKWYSSVNKNLKRNPSKYQFITKEYIRLKIDILSGKKINIKNGICKNYNYFLKIIQNYKEIWGTKKNKVPMHGDLSLDNILFFKDEVYFIDWEHFNDKSTYWGFDIYYLLFETLWFCWSKFNKSINKEIYHLSLLIKILIDNDKKTLHNKYYKLETLKVFISKNKNLWSKQLERNPDKLPLLKFSNQDVKYIDDLILEHIKN